MSNDIILTGVRLSFNDLFRAKEDKTMPDGSVMKGGFRAVVFLDKKDKEQFKVLNDHIKEVFEAKFGKEAKINKNKIPYKNGDDSDRDEQEGFWVISAKEKPEYPPIVVGRKNEVLRPDSGLPYSGCYVNIRIRAYAFDYLGKGVALSLKAVQFVRDGAPFGVARITADDAFEVLDDADDEDVNDFLGGEDDSDDIPF